MRLLLKDRDGWFGLLVAAFGIGLYVYIGRQPWAGFNVPELIGPVLFPRLLSVAIATFGLWLLLARIVAVGRARALPEPESSLLVWEAVIIIGAGLLYVLLLPLAGFTLSTPVFLYALCVYWGAGYGLRTAAASVLATLVIHASAGRLLGIELPAGLLGVWLGWAG